MNFKLKTKLKDERVLSNTGASYRLKAFPVLKEKDLIVLWMLRLDGEAP